MATQFYFDDIKPVILQNLTLARKSVRIAVAWLNFESYFPIFKKLLENGVSLTIVIDDNNSNRKQQAIINDLISFGAEIKFFAMPVIPGFSNGRTAIMHHKFAIIDDQIVLGGSYNWSAGADYNFEHLYVVQNEPVVVGKFYSEFAFLVDYDTATVSALQNLPACEEAGCKGKRFNLLIFDPTTADEHGVYGDLVSVCSAEPHDHFDTVDTAVPGRFLQNLAEGKAYHYEELFEMISADGDKMPQSEIEKRMQEIDMLLENESALYAGKFVNGRRQPVHAIAKLQSEPMRHRHEDPDWFVLVLWKQKFCCAEIDDSFETTFDMR